MDALRAAGRAARWVSSTGTAIGYRENIEQIAVSLERRGDLIALNEHLFDAMWTYWAAVASRIA